MKIQKVITYKVDSFTLTEIIVSMIIMSVLAMASYALFINTGSLIQMQQDEVSETVDNSLSYSTLAYDIAHAHSVYFTSTKELLIDNEIKPDITYIFDETNVLRKLGERTDTFKIQCIIQQSVPENKSILSLQVIKDQDTIPVLFSLPVTAEIKSNQYLHDQ